MKLVPDHPLRRAATTALAATLALSGAVASTAPASAVEQDVGLTRVQGADRHGTAAALARAAFPDGATTAIVARSDDFADALSANYLAGVRQAPLLLTRTDALPAATASALADLGVDEVVLVGGAAAVSDQVQAALAADYRVTRVAGTDRYLTAATIARGAASVGGVGHLDGLRTAILANGQDFADAMAAGPLAFARKHPVLITRPTDLPRSTADALQTLGIERVVVAGQTAAVSADVQTEVERLTGHPALRVGGQDRYGTAAALAELAWDRLGFDRTHVDLARGDDFADALAGGPHAGREAAPIVLTAGQALSPATADLLRRRGVALTDGHVLGGPSAVSAAVVTAAQQAAQGAAPAPPPTTPPTTPPPTAPVDGLVGSVHQIHVSDTEPGTPVTVEGPGGWTAAGTTDENGALILRSVPAGTHQVRLAGAAAGTVTVVGAADHPPAAFYAAQDLPTGGGYLETRDGTLLAYQVVLPDPAVHGPGPYPVVVDYSGYMPSLELWDGVGRRFPALGYAAVGVNMRGTACSGGAFDYFEELQAVDGYDVVEALAAQPWSDGVALVGKSYPGISQLFVASTQPPSLEAIVPGHALSEFYRDVAYPGGMLNVGFAVSWGTRQDAIAAFPSYYERVNEAAAADPVCAANQEFRGQNASVVTGMQTHPTDGPYWSERAPERLVDQITVPTLLVDSWQDEQVGSGSANLLERFPASTEARLLGTNGDHGEYYRGEVFEEVVRFLDVYLGDSTEAEVAQYEAEDPVTVFLETGVPGSAEEGEPRATFTLDRLATGDEGRRWYLRDGEQLSDAPPQPEEDATTTYVHRPLPLGEQLMSGENTWSAPPAPGDVASFMTAPLDSDVVMAGSGSLDLVLSSEAADTDVEVTLSEVRPDGSEMLVQSGWLRASHRALDEDASTVLRPRHLHTAASLQPLVPGEAAEMRVRLFPFAHAFRAGSRIKVAVDAPGGNRTSWAFALLPGQHTNTVWHSPAHVSSVVLPVVDVTVPLGEQPACGTVSSQPCRP